MPYIPTVKRETNTYLYLYWHDGGSNRLSAILKFNCWAVTADRKWQGVWWSDALMAPRHMDTRPHQQQWMVQWQLGHVATWPHGHTNTNEWSSGNLDRWTCGHTNNVVLSKVAVGMMPRGCCNFATLQCCNMCRPARKPDQNQVCQVARYGLTFEYFGPRTRYWRNSKTSRFLGHMTTHGSF